MLDGCQLDKMVRINKSTSEKWSHKGVVYLIQMILSYILYH